MPSRSRVVGPASSFTSCSYTYRKTMLQQIHMNHGGHGIKASFFLHPTARARPALGYWSDRSHDRLRRPHDHAVEGKMILGHVWQKERKLLSKTFLVPGARVEIRSAPPSSSYKRSRYMTILQLTPCWFKFLPPRRTSPFSVFWNVQFGSALGSKHLYKLDWVKSNNFLPESVTSLYG